MNDRMQNINKTVDLNTLETIEVFLGFKFPLHYKRFLLVTNGGKPIKRVFSIDSSFTKKSVLKYFFSITPERNKNILLENKLYGDRIPKNMWSIGKDDFGNRVLLNVGGKNYGKVYFWDHEKEVEEDQEPTYDNLTLIANDFDEFMDSLQDMND